MNSENPDEPQPQRSTAVVVAAVLAAFLVATVGLVLVFELVEGNLF